MRVSGWSVSTETNLLVLCMCPYSNALDSCSNSSNRQAVFIFVPVCCAGRHILEWWYSRCATYCKFCSCSVCFLQTGVRESIAATYELERIWKSSAAVGRNSSSQLGKFAFSWYAASQRGVYRIYPAVRVPKNYDPTRQPWWVNPCT